MSDPPTRVPKETERMDLEEIMVRVDEEIIDLLPIYIENRKTELMELRDDLSTGDLTKIGAAGHTMKGSGGGFGLDRVSRIGSELEAASKLGDPAQIGKLLDELADFLERVQVYSDD